MSDTWHRATFAAIPSYFDEDTSCLVGRNAVCDFLIESVIALANLGCFGWMEQWPVLMDESPLSARDQRRLDRILARSKDIRFMEEE